VRDHRVEETGDVFLEGGFESAEEGLIGDFIVKPAEFTYIRREGKKNAK